MDNPFKIVKDSSIWQNSSSFSAVNHKDPFIRIGIVKGVFVDNKTSDLRYLVTVQDRNDSINVNAKMLRQFGGVYNYQDTVLRGYKTDDKPDPVADFSAKAGDAVLVAFLNGEAREAVILGAILHPARKVKLDITKGPQFLSEFNGVETSINDNGEYKLTFKAIPKNIDKLKEKPNKPIPEPQYNEDVGGSFFTFDKTGSIEINDKDKNGVQNLRIDKPKGSITVNSGKISLTMTKKDEKVEIKCKVINTTAIDKITNKTKEYELDASKSVKIKSPKIAIGKDGVELLDQLYQLIEKLGAVIPISPVGPCSSLMATPQWSGVKDVQSKIKDITGAL